MLNSCSIFDYEWQYNTSTGTKIKSFGKSINEWPITLAICADNRDDYIRAGNELLKNTEIDLINLKPGKLYIGDEYMTCYIRASKKKDWLKGIPFMFNEITVVTDHPYWVEEELYVFQPYQSLAAHGYLDYPFDYDYDYLAPGVNKSAIMVEHYAPCHYSLDIFGPCVNPSILLGQTPCAVTVELEKGEYLHVDSRKKTVVRVANDGIETNLFNSRRKDVSIFKQINPGMCAITWAGNYGFNMTLYKERSEPRWTL